MLLDELAVGERLPFRARDVVVDVPLVVENRAGGGRRGALERGADQVETEIAGQPWVQKPFPYQGKCLTWLRESYAGLSRDARATADGMLESTGCEALFR